MIGNITIKQLNIPTREVRQLIKAVVVMAVVTGV